MSLTDCELRRTARHLSLPGFGIHQQEKLHDSHLLVIGAGGLGCPALQSLAAAGIGTITVIDDDTVDITNIHRQILFGADDVGQLKVEVAARRLKQLQPGINVRAVAQRLTVDNALELFSSADMVLDGSDSFSTKYLAADAAEITGVPLIWATVLQYHGDVAYFRSGPDFRGVGLRDLFPVQPDADSVPDCAEAGVLGATTATMGALMATQAIGLLAGIGGVNSTGGIAPGYLLSYDAFPSRSRVFHVGADPQRQLRTRLEPDYGGPACAAPAGLNARALVEAVRGGEFLALDIREPHEHLLADLPAGAHSVKLPLSDIDSPERVRSCFGGFPHGAQVLVYCASGKRSAAFVEEYTDLATSAGLSLTSLPGGVNAL
ncbi:ThiF family adenylyltransferase [Corynebacterium flavescens]|uniref:ThiF family adenylyltransferase n=1 Tax=Corynebacterium flavescens TaxID=28028 RepID=UPI0026471869|nr:ThiF family adenylyltransferase [Corynebacterium flavescens]MDN6552253.1 ThiF family adenylyltransferase [Corynebacterium flavescens]